MVKHPVLAGATAGCLEISVTFPFEVRHLPTHPPNLISGDQKLCNSWVHYITCIHSPTTN